MDNHDAHWCYINPESPVYKEDVRVRKVGQAKSKGVDLPDYLKEERPKKKGGSVGMVAPNSGKDEGLAEDILGALRMVGCLSEEEVQGHLDGILDAHQAREGLVATICHQSDGNEPTSIMSVGEGDHLVTPRLSPSTWDRLMEGGYPRPGHVPVAAPGMEGAQRDGGALHLQAVTSALLAAA
jgi:hypothetical protein